MRRFFQLGFLLIAVLTILEYLFVTGMFTSFIVMGLVWLAGLVNLIYALKDKDYTAAGLYLVCTIALNMGYWKLLFF